MYSSNLGAMVTSGNTDNGEFLKINLGSSKKAHKLSLKGTSTGPSEIKDFKLYASLNNVTWEELHSETNANIITTGVDYEFTNTNKYQHYGIVVTKTDKGHCN